MEGSIQMKLPWKGGLTPRLLILSTVFLGSLLVAALWWWEIIPQKVEIPGQEGMELSDRNPLSLDLRSNDIEEVIRGYARLMNTSSPKASLHLKLGNAFFLNHEFARARNHYKKALKLDPNLAVAQENLEAIMAGGSS